MKGRFFAIVAFSFVAVASGMAATRDNAIVHELGSHLTERSRAEGFSGAVLLAKGDKILFEKAYGSAGSNSPAKVDTQFHLASVTKVFTAIAVLQLSQAG